MGSMGQFFRHLNWPPQFSNKIFSFISTLAMFLGTFGDTGLFEIKKLWRIVSKNPIGIKPGVDEAKNVGRNRQ